jgi:hypothetical protein
VARDIQTALPLSLKSSRRATALVARQSTKQQGMVMITTAAPPRVATKRDEFKSSLGPYFDQISQELGFEPYLWQSLVNDVSSMLSPRDESFPGQSALKFHSSHVGVLVGRQSGKTKWAAARVTGQALLPNRDDIAELVGLRRIIPQKIIYTAQKRTTAVERWREHCGVILDSPLGRYVEHLGTQNGHESLTFTNGSTYSPVTPSKNAARGIAADLIIVDEALTHPMWLLGTLRPTMAQRHSANGCIGSQFIVISNAGTDDSELLNHLQELGHRAIKADDDSRVWLEWSMEPGSDPLAEATWIDTMPTLNQPNGISLEFMREEIQSMRLGDFMREYLCHKTNDSDDRVIDYDQWMTLHRDDVWLPNDPVLAIDVSWDRQRAAIVACSNVGEYLPIEVIDSREGVDWLVDRTIDIAERRGCAVVVDTGGPAASLVMILENRGIEVIPYAAKDVANAAGCFYDNVRNKRITHMNDYRLNDAIKGATKRPIGERWGFNRKGNVDISPLVAASFAVYAIESGRYDKPTLFT